MRVPFFNKENVTLGRGTPRLENNELARQTVETQDKFLLVVSLNSM